MSLTVKLRYVHEDVDRYGNVRLYFWRRGGRKIRLHEKFGSPEFFRRYHELVEADPSDQLSRPEGPLRPSAGTFRWLCVEYMRSPDFRRLGAASQRNRKGVIESMCLEPVKPDSATTFASVPLDALSAKALRVLRDRKEGLPEAANTRVKVLRQVFAWAVEEEHIEENPARDLKRLRNRTGGHHTWTTDELGKYIERHPLGTKAHLAFCLFLFSGCRRSDVVRLGRQHRRGNWLSFRPAKGGADGVTVEVPILHDLQRALDAGPCGDMTFLVTESGQPFTPAGFGNWFRERCLEAGVPGRAHGIRKAGATLLAERGATAHQLMAIFGWMTLKEAERYTRAAQRKQMAADGMPLLGRIENEMFPTKRAVGTKQAKSRGKSKVD